MPRVSIITPTFEREPFLPLIHKVVQAQTYPDWEWLLYDNSLVPSPYLQAQRDPRIHYYYKNDSRLSIGEKRNWLNAQASGDVIVHFDDDDYYAPHYLETLLKALETHAFFTLHSWFCYALREQRLFYWETDTSERDYFVLTPSPKSSITQTTLKAPSTLNFQLGYGFSYAYHREIAAAFPFSHINWGEDIDMVSRLVAEKVPLHLLRDQKGLALHIMHATNSSRAFPQFELPVFLLRQTLFPKVGEYFDALGEAFREW